MIHKVVLGLGILSLLLLVILSAIGFLSFGKEAGAILSTERTLTPQTLVGLLDIVLLVFIVIELLKIAIAFLEERQVILTVFEAVLVAVARKIIVSGTDPIDFDKAAALALITVAVGVTWWLVTHGDERRLSSAPPSVHAIEELPSPRHPPEERKAS